MYICMFDPVYVCMYVCMYVHMYVCIYEVHMYVCRIVHFIKLPDLRNFYFSFCMARETILSQI